VAPVTEEAMHAIRFERQSGDLRRKP
jgi:hypothetical protein